MKKIISIVFFIYLIVPTASLAITNFSISYFCGSTGISLSFDKYSINPDIEVQFSKYLINPDYTVSVVKNEFLADIIVIDDQLIYDYLICSSKKKVFTTKISEFSNDPDLKIKIVEYSQNPDFKIYFDSDIFSLQEAIVIAAMKKSSIY